MRPWAIRALLSLSVAVACARATDERILADGDDDDSAGESGTGASPSGGSAGFGGSQSSGGASARGGAATGGASVTGGQGGTTTTGGSAGSGGSDSGGASDGGEGGTDPCTVAGAPAAPRVDYKEGARPVTDDPGGEFQLRNATTAAIPLSELSIRYWFTSEYTCAETTDSFVVNIDDFRFQSPHVEQDKADVTSRVVALDTGAPGCDAYFELGFSADTGNLAPNQYASVVYHAQIPIYTRPHDQANDYSYGACTSLAVYFDRVTVYRNGRLVTGSEPGGGGGESGAGGEGGSGI